MRVGEGRDDKDGGEKRWKVRRKEYVIPEVRSMTVLGSRVDQDGKSEETVEKQIRDGEKAYFGKKTVWGKHGAWKDKARKWQRDVQSVVLWVRGSFRQASSTV